ncbi:MAG: SDR family NAD(P)-dependent oxidoreductase, partial [Actinomycetota bacterium]
MTGLLEGKVALITGAGAGIGSAVTERFAGEGATLWLNDRDGDALATVCEQAGAVGATVDGSAGDASEPA